MKKWEPRHESDWDRPRPPDRTLHRLCAGIQRGRLGPSSVSSPQWKATRSSPCPRWRHVLLTRQAVFAGRLRCFWPRLCKNVFQCARHSKPDWKSRFYGKSTSADVPINSRFNVEAHTSILATRFYTLWPELVFRLTTAEQAAKARLAVFNRSTAGVRLEMPGL